MERIIHMEAEPQVKDMSLSEKLKTTHAVGFLDLGYSPGMGMPIEFRRITPDIITENPDKLVEIKFNFGEAVFAKELILDEPIQFDVQVRNRTIHIDTDKTRLVLDKSSHNTFAENYLAVSMGIARLETVVEESHPAYREAVLMELQSELKLLRKIRDGMVDGSIIKVGHTNSRFSLEKLKEVAQEKLHFADAKKRARIAFGAGAIALAACVSSTVAPTPNVDVAATAMANETHIVETQESETQSAKFKLTLEKVAEATASWKDKQVKLVNTGEAQVKDFTGVPPSLNKAGELAVLNSMNGSGEVNPSEEWISGSVTIDDPDNPEVAAMHVLIRHNKINNEAVAFGLDLLEETADQRVFGVLELGPDGNIFGNGQQFIVDFNTNGGALTLQFPDGSSTSLVEPEAFGEEAPSDQVPQEYVQQFVSFDTSSEIGVLPPNIESQKDKLVEMGFSVKDGKITMTDEVEEGKIWDVLTFNSDGTASVKLLDANYKGRELKLTAKEVENISVMSLNGGHDNLLVIKNEKGGVEKMFLPNVDETKSTESGWVEPIKLDDPNNLVNFNNYNSLRTDHLRISALIGKGSEVWGEGFVPAEFWMFGDGQADIKMSWINVFTSPVGNEGRTLSTDPDSSRVVGFASFGEVKVCLVQTLISSDGESVILPYGYSGALANKDEYLQESAFKLSNKTATIYQKRPEPGQNGTPAINFAWGISQNRMAAVENLLENDPNNQPWKLLPPDRLTTVDSFEEVREKVSKDILEKWQRMILFPYQYN